MQLDRFRPLLPPHNTPRRSWRTRLPQLLTSTLIAGLLAAGCTAVDRQTDLQVRALIQARQQAALGEQTPIEPLSPGDFPPVSDEARAPVPEPATPAVPECFETVDEPRAPETRSPLVPPAPEDPDVVGPPAEALYAQIITPSSSTIDVVTLTDAWAYAQRHRREYQTAKEDLYLAALALTLERHLWTPIFASNLRTVYGNFGEAQDFDQAMRFVADLAVTQRLPYGGEFTAQAISTLIRDVGKTITAREQSEIELGVNIPLLRNGGPHVAREQLIQLERELTYSVRTFERFRRQQLVTVARSYFSLLRVKQRVIDSEASYQRAQSDYARAREVEDTLTGNPLDTLRAEQRMLSAENALENAREDFRSAADDFKLVIGMPIDAPLGMDDLPDIETIEEAILAGRYPLLQRVDAVTRQERAVTIALQRRLDLRTRQDRIDDGHRGVAISRNALLPDLDWSGTLTFDTDPAHYNLGAFNVDRANWRTELLLSLPLERTAERNQLRRAMIDVRRAQRNWQDLSERIRADVRSAVNQIRLQEINLRIQRRNYEVASRRATYAAIKFEQGELSNRDKVEAETELLNAQNALNQAKTARWSALLQFRLETETLLVDEAGQQQEVLLTP
jgi:outer membrane protein TolC